MKNYGPLTEIEGQELTRAVSQVSVETAGKSAAAKVLSLVSASAEKMNFPLHEQLEALAEPYGTLSPSGAYLRVQALAVQFLTPLGALILQLVGLITVFQKVKTAGVALFNKLKSWFSIGSAIANPGGIGGLLGAAVKSIFHDEGPVPGSGSPDGLDMAASSLLALVPGPYGMIASQLSSAVSGAPLNANDPLSKPFPQGSPTPTTGVPTQQRSTNILGTILKAVGGVASGIGSAFGDVSRMSDGEYADAADQALQRILRASEELGIQDPLLERAFGEVHDEVVSDEVVSDHV